MTESDFAAFSWHDNHIYGLELLLGEPELDDWTSELVLDIDHIVEWVPTQEGMRFRLAPATLVFHGVTDLRIDVDWGATGFRVAPTLLSIHCIERERIADQKVYLDGPYYRWGIRLNAPEGGEISFGAFGFTQTLRREPVLHSEQHLGARLRGSHHD
jgi:hypothetical protein